MPSLHRESNVSRAGASHSYFHVNQWFENREKSKEVLWQCGCDRRVTTVKFHVIRGVNTEKQVRRALIFISPVTVSPAPLASSPRQYGMKDLTMCCIALTPNGSMGPLSVHWLGSSLVRSHYNWRSVDFVHGSIYWLNARPIIKSSMTLLLKISMPYRIQ